MSPVLAFYSRRPTTTQLAATALRVAIVNVSVTQLLPSMQNACGSLHTGTRHYQISISTYFIDCEHTQDVCCMSYILASCTFTACAVAVLLVYACAVSEQSARETQLVSRSVFTFADISDAGASETASMFANHTKYQLKHKHNSTRTSNTTTYLADAYLHDIIASTPMKYLCEQCMSLP